MESRYAELKDRHRANREASPPGIRLRIYLRNQLKSILNEALSR